VVGSVDAAGAAVAGAGDMAWALLAFIFA